MVIKLLNTSEYLELCEAIGDEIFSFQSVKLIKNYNIAPSGAAERHGTAAVRPAADHHAQLLRGKALGHHRAVADVAAQRFPNHHGEVSRRRRSVLV